MTKDEAIKKIQKLLNLATDNDKEEEMKTAMKIAHSILRKFNMEMSDIEVKEEVENMTTEEGIVFTRTYAWIWNISEAIDCLCDTNHFRSGRGWKFKMHFAGTKTDVAAALGLFNFLYETIQQMGNDIKLPGIRERNSYCNGVGYRVHQRASEMIEKEREEDTSTESIEGSKCQALVCMKKQELSTYMERTHDIKRAKATTVTGDNMAFMMGMADGDSVPLGVSPGLDQ